MNITVTANRTLRSISEDFNSQFPYLKLEFYTRRHEKGEENLDWDHFNPNLTINDAGNFDH
ncbi:MAG: hypothetical protein AAGI38_25195, partial [Bacteroidota bacterium]